MLASLPPGSVAIDAALYCRVPQDSPLNVRGVRTIPCETVPGTPAPTSISAKATSGRPAHRGFNGKRSPDADSPTRGYRSIHRFRPGAATAYQDLAVDVGP